MIEIIEDVVVIYTNGIIEEFEVVRITDRGIIIGRVFNGEFVDCGFISQQNIKEIKFNNKNNIKRI